MDIKEKTKDNLNARQDLKSICNRLELELDERRPNVMPKEAYTLSKEQKRRVYEWIKGLQFPDVYASNFARCVDMMELRMLGMKSHGCHVFMQKLIPIAFREMLPKHVWIALIEVSLLFQSICSTTLDVHKLHELKNNIAIILCNLEKIFPLAFFESMEHLIVHLPYEARVGGPVQYRWMYLFERFLRELKKKVKNKAHLEASIVEAYITEEIGLFMSQYFESSVQYKRTMPRRNDERANNDHGIQVSIFNYPSRASGAPKKRWLTGSERHIIETYILTNCEVVTPYYKSYLNELYQHHHWGDPIIDQLVSTGFNDWFKRRVHLMLNSTENELLKSHYWDSSAEVTSVPCYFVNGFNFHTERHNTGKSTMNCVSLGRSSEGMKVHPRYHFVDINFKKLYQKDESFILAQQAVQVYFTQYPSLKRDKADWFAVAKVKARRVVDESKWTEICAYQPDEVLPVLVVGTDNQTYDLRDPNSLKVMVNNEAAGTSRSQACQTDDDNKTMMKTTSRMTTLTMMNTN
ncbi:UNVERIFIED_CONTAM: hypothetical protein Slati_3061500 [Sesamum latifolium]|uniref:DUF4218 domain-containing protein n=1 Tax=Sesamum latifolium TaxID=2727402 RepID=A0AAW2UYZ3_9LAMI